MRIVMACAAFPPFMDGGGPISALLTAKLLISAGHQVTVLNVGDEARDEIYDGVPVRRLAPLNIYWNYRVPRPAWKKLVWHALENFNPRAFAVMRREIGRQKPDLVLTDSIENINVATWAAARSLGVPVCHILRSAFLLCWRGGMMRGADACGRVCSSCRATSIGKRISSQFVDGVIGETEFIVERHLREGYFGAARSCVIPGVLPASGRAAPRAHRVGEKLRVGFIGVHTPMKGLDILAEAARAMSEADPVEFVIAGTGSGAYAESLPAKFPSDRTRFLGWSDPFAFFPQIDVLVVPSRFEEPFGRVIIEAFAHGVPVLGARSGGIPETITPGVDGFTFDTEDAAGLAGLIRKIAASDDLLAALSAGAHAAAERYLPERLAPLYSDFFATILRAKGAAAWPVAEPRVIG
jgi:glycosyltransferase involved in cell wall biosynthesis